jgi:hypothetical protein
MSAYDINLSKGFTIDRLLDAKFPAIPSTKNEPTPLLTIRTVAYIHALVIDTVSLNHSDTPNQRALCTEQLIIDEHGGVDPALWRAKILDCLAGYFEGILKMEGASGISQVIAPARKYRDKKIPVVTAKPVDGASVADPPPGAPASPAAPPEEAPAAAETEAAEAAAAEAEAAEAETPAPAPPPPPPPAPAPASASARGGRQRHRGGGT